MYIIYMKGEITDTGILVGSVSGLEFEKLGFFSKGFMPHIQIQNSDKI